MATAVSTYFLLMEKEDVEKYGCGLNAIDKLGSTSKMVDITDSDFSDHLDDSTATANWARVMKGDQVYRVIKNFYDLNTNRRILMCKNETDSFDLIT